MLKRLFTSNTRIKLLTVFLMNPEEEYFIRELTRKLDEQINSIRRELDNLKRAGLLKTKAKNRKKYYVVNKEFPLFEELKSIIIKALSSEQTIARDLEKMGDVKLLVLSGQFINIPTKSVDMLVVGDLDKNTLTNYLNNEVRTKHPVKFALISENDYKYRINCNDKFMLELLNDENNQIPINKV
ncbi:MAG: winged helix-turn-helix domain-containing protein [Candidatus Gracilibacteria bacterium]